MKAFYLFLAATCGVALAADPAPAPLKVEKPEVTSPPPMIAPGQIARPTGDGLKFTLKQAEDIAVKNHPRILSAQLTADAVRQQIREARSGFFPQIYAESNSVYAPEGTRLAALNGINNPSIFSRQSDGLTASQLITDFGRTFDLTQQAHFQADAAESRVDAARAAIVLAVDRAYFDVRRAQAVLDVSRDTVKARQFSSDQIDVLLKIS